MFNLYTEEIWTKVIQSFTEIKINFSTEYSLIKMSIYNFRLELLQKTFHVSPTSPTSTSFLFRTSSDWEELDKVTYLYSAVNLSLKDGTCCHLLKSGACNVYLWPVTLFFVQP